MGKSAMIVQAAFPIVETFHVAIPAPDFTGRVIIKELRWKIISRIIENWNRIVYQILHKPIIGIWPPARKGISSVCHWPLILLSFCRTVFQDIFSSSFFRVSFRHAWRKNRNREFVKTPVNPDCVRHNNRIYCFARVPKAYNGYHFHLISVNIWCLLLVFLHFPISNDGKQ